MFEVLILGASTQGSRPDYRVSDLKRRVLIV
jgi:hypothetical protein